MRPTVKWLTFAGCGALLLPSMRIAEACCTGTGDPSECAIYMGPPMTAQVLPTNHLQICQQDANPPPGTDWHAWLQSQGYAISPEDRDLKVEEWDEGPIDADPENCCEPCRFIRHQDEYLVDDGRFEIICSAVDLTTVGDKEMTCMVIQSPPSIPLYCLGDYVQYYDDPPVSLTVNIKVVCGLEGCGECGESDLVVFKAPLDGASQQLCTTSKNCLDGCCGITLGPVAVRDESQFWACKPPGECVVEFGGIAQIRVRSGICPFINVTGAAPPVTKQNACDFVLGFSKGNGCFPLYGEGYANNQCVTIHEDTHVEQWHFYIDQQIPWFQDELRKMCMPVCQANCENLLAAYKDSIYQLMRSAVRRAIDEGDRHYDADEDEALEAERPCNQAVADAIDAVLGPCIPY